LKYPIYYTSEAVHSVRFSLSKVRRVFLSRARGKEQETTGHLPLETGVWLTGACATADRVDVKALGAINTHATSRWEELPHNHLAAWDGSCCG